MSKKKTTTDKITDVDEQMKQLAEEKKALQKLKREEEQEEQKQRCHRRGVKVEKQLPDLATFTDEQFNIFAEKVLFTEQTKTIISEILTPQPTPSRSVKPPSKLKGDIDEPLIAEPPETDGVLDNEQLTTQGNES
jgi:hypothetical protein